MRSEVLLLTTDGSRCKVFLFQCRLQLLLLIKPRPDGRRILQEILKLNFREVVYELVCVTLGETESSDWDRLGWFTCLSVCIVVYMAVCNPNQLLVHG